MPLWGADKKDFSCAHTHTLRKRENELAADFPFSPHKENSCCRLFFPVPAARLVYLGLGCMEEVCFCKAIKNVRKGCASYIILRKDHLSYKQTKKHAWRMKKGCLLPH
jgi:hypothetical protein